MNLSVVTILSKNNHRDTENTEVAQRSLRDFASKVGMAVGSGQYRER